MDEENANYEVDLPASGGGIFADVDSVYQRNSFQDDRSIFSTPNDPPVNAKNPTTTTGADEQRFETVPTSDKPRRLLARFDHNREMWVSIFEGRQQLENWRAPTKEEFALFRDRGRFVKGGLASVPDTAAPAAEPPKKSIVKPLLGVGVALAAAYGAYRLYKHYKEDDESAEVVDV
jgi:hypothetical protein